MHPLELNGKEGVVAKSDPGDGGRWCLHMDGIKVGRQKK